MALHVLAYNLTRVMNINNFTQGKIKRRQKQIEESVARYRFSHSLGQKATFGRS